MTRCPRPRAARGSSPRWPRTAPLGRLLCNRESVAALAAMSVTTMTLRIPDELAPSIRAAAAEAGMSVNTYVVRAARRAATLDAARQLAVLGLGEDLVGEATRCEAR
ncbi:toxin-antitoxin system HicB family antitoxin [Streptomyces sp. NPDC055692]|uniref:toxin-antitoxin system HicB family antitoxin n=1 Tax=Streptomyces sp. NPDC055692 TaxID=3155683 RepID=UPI003426C718